MYHLTKFNKVLDSIIYPELAYRSIKKDYSKEKNVDEKKCKKCGGKCCKKCGCHFSPDDFSEISFEALKKEITKGYISIDFIAGEMIDKDFGIYFLRIRNRNMPIVDLDFKRTPCILLGEQGCKLTYDKRPSGGKLLIPAINDEGKLICHSSYDIRSCAYEWEPHQKVLNILIKYFKNRDFKCLID